MEIFLIRHAESEGNRLRRGGGTYNWELTEFGIEQANALGKASFVQSITHIYSSPLKRALKTAESLSSATGKPILVDGLISDVNAGSLNGAEWQDIRDKYLDFFKAVPRNPDIPFPGGGETNRDVIERTRIFVNTLRNRFRIEEYTFDRSVAIAIVSHGLPLNYLMLHLLEHEPIGIECLLLANAAVAQISFKLRYPMLISFNDVRHLVKEGSNLALKQGMIIDEDRGPAG